MRQGQKWEGREGGECQWSVESKHLRPLLFAVIFASVCEVKVKYFDIVNAGGQESGGDHLWVFANLSLRSAVGHFWLSIRHLYPLTSTHGHTWDCFLTLDFSRGYSVKSLMAGQAWRFPPMSCLPEGHSEPASLSASVSKFLSFLSVLTVPASALPYHPPSLPHFLPSLFCPWLRSLSSFSKIYKLSLR